MPKQSRSNTNSLKMEKVKIPHSGKKVQTSSKSREKYLLRTYGISLSQYNKILKNQKDCCGVCGKHKSEETRNLAVDHNHMTREIRGILCFKCNHFVIGRHRDPELLQKASDYLRKGTGLFVPVKVKKKRKSRNWQQEYMMEPLFQQTGN